MDYDVIIVGAGPGGIFSALELIRQTKDIPIKIAIFDKGHELKDRVGPSVNNNQNCYKCDTCSIMSGFGGAGAFSDGKYTITNEYGGNLYSYIGYKEALDLMNYVDSINLSFANNNNIDLKLYKSDNNNFYRECLKQDLHILNSNIRHLGTDVNYHILLNICEELINSNKIDFYFNTEISSISINDEGNFFVEDKNKNNYISRYIIASVGRSGSSWIRNLCDNLGINYSSNRVDIGVRVELPFEIFKDITDQVYESKIVYRTALYQDLVRTFCMNPHGRVVTEKSEGVITVNGHSYTDPCMYSNNTNFALLVSKTMTEPFNSSTNYAKSIASMCNMLSGGVMVQRLGDLIRGRRTTEDKIHKSFVKPTLCATPGDLSLVLPKRILDSIIEMIYKLDKIAPGTANDDTLLYGVEIKLYNLLIDLNKNLESKYQGLYIIGDGSGVTHSLSQASASGVYVARNILREELR